ncbi:MULTISPECIES: sigma-54-dependent transcriptional regulator [Salegentibacter]|jgi:two-component system response regulator HydG|uniref:Two-component system, NtrC family, response regulator HydG n=1 Tax=Salegentibacter agarivorans TaxID=345907 RepID=A0A1I2NY99_9FLAO|nr:MULTISPECIES: sigma-54 dependent transcriptional regulator [Salegentibacter]APS38375.1 two-component system response regulator [Salegentibacter sp. T436]SFG06476.1 two-component system, NtrC family, response regulator HydG [Salegentibacter agarivorans]
MTKILIVEDDVPFGTMLKTFLIKRDYEVELVFSGLEAFKKLKANFFNLILSDVRLPDTSGLDILKQVKLENAGTQVIIMTSYAEISMAVEAMKNGAFDYVSKPFRPESILQTIKNALTHTEVQPTVEKRPEKTQRTDSLQGTSFVKGVSEAALKLSDYIELVAPTNMSVLIMGESGTGKEQVAKSIHKQSKRADAPFIAVDCGAIPRELASSEFFGHLKGSFTGAINDKTGHFEAANGGTLFLDEIGNLSYELQVQLLRALQERKIKPVGSNNEIQVDIRVITATNEDLAQAVKEGEFREDLYHRLNEFSIKVPALKERKEDLMLFAEYFLEEANAELEKNVIGFTESAIEAFKNYNWPGNLRELKNMVKRAVLLTQDDMIPLKVLPHEIATASQSNTETEYGLFKNKNEEQLILDALEKAGGNKSKAARLLSIDRKTLYNKLKQYDIKL